MHIEAISRSQPEELKSIISVEEKLQWKSIGKVDSSPPPLIRIHASAGKSKRVPTMPKRYLPYQVERRAGHQTTKVVKKEVVVCKSVGSNGLVFTSDGGSEEEDSDDVDVESCDNSILDGGRKSVVTLQDEEMKEPTRRKTTPVLSKGEEEGGCSPPPATNHANTMAFVAILLHALKCSSCEKPACRKMIMVLQHYKQCAFKRKVSLSEGSRAGQNCKICAQLLRIVALHAKNDCKMHPTQMGCPVLMCDTFRLASYANNNKKVQQPNVKKIDEAVDATKRGVVTIGRRVVVTQQPN